ncbi:MAG TPA: alpha/beta hydrolase [Chitinophagaceae bacterium]|nr:alpha/beta hydrolase [Chitinophagaceae bacterium]
MQKLLLLFTVIFVSYSDYAQVTPGGSNLITYKTIDTSHLKMEVIYPPNMKAQLEYPCIVFFYGGGWLGGTMKQFKPFAQYFAQKGLVCFLADYRTKEKDGTTPFESLKDARSAIRFIRKNAAKFHINEHAIIASGGSAGGHLAAATALVNGFDEPTDDLSVSCIPNALVLFNPVIDNGPGGYGYERIGEQYRYFSPLHNIHKGAPPTIIFLGTKDKLIPTTTMEYFQTVMERLGSRCELKLYEGQDHGFFNKKEFVEKTIKEADMFLTSLGYIH